MVSPYFSTVLLGFSRLFGAETRKEAHVRQSFTFHLGDAIMDIKVNEAQWQSLSPSEKENITKIVTGHFKGASIFPDAATPAVDATRGGFGLTNPFCKAACDIAQAAAVAACSTIGGPIAIAACIAAAQIGGDACRNSC